MFAFLLCLLGSPSICIYLLVVGTAVYFWYVFMFALASAIPIAMFWMLVVHPKYGCMTKRYLDMYMCMCHNKPWWPSAVDGESPLFLRVAFLSMFDVVITSMFSTAMAVGALFLSGRFSYFEVIQVEYNMHDSPAWYRCFSNNMQQSFDTKLQFIKLWI
jgi:hypothetical protein